MSFFDEVDEPRTEPTPQRRRRTTGGGRRPPSRRPPSGRPPGISRRSRLRRAIAVAALVVVIILIVIGVHSCQVSARNSSLKDYNNNVASLIQESNQTGKQFFGVLSNGSSAGDAANLQNQIDETGVTADSSSSRAKGLDVPDEVKAAQQNLLLSAADARDGITNIAQQIQPALSNADQQGRGQQHRRPDGAVLRLRRRLQGYTLPLIAGALKSAGSSAGPADQRRSVPPQPAVADALVRRQALHVLVAHRPTPAPPSPRPACTATRWTRSASAAPRCRPARPTRSRRARRRRSR